MSDLKQSGRAVIEGGDIVIRIAISALPVILDASPRGFSSLYRVSNASVLAGEIRDALNDEEEDGTLVHRLFDDAIGAAIENGAEGVEDKEEEPAQ